MIHSLKKNRFKESYTEGYQCINSKDIIDLKRIYERFKATETNGRVTFVTQLKRECKNENENKFIKPRNNKGKI